MTQGIWLSWLSIACSMFALGILAGAHTEKQQQHPCPAEALRIYEHIQEVCTEDKPNPTLYTRDAAIRIVCNIADDVDGKGVKP